MLVYKITNTVTGNAYVGVTVTTARRRWYSHCHDATRGVAYPLYHAIRKYGRDAFSLEVLCECSSVEEMMVCEKALVAAHGTMVPNGYNLTSGGEGWAGRRSPETVARMSAAQRRRVAEGRGMKGRRHTPETKRRMSESQKRRPARAPKSAETRAKMSAAMKANPKVMAQARAAARVNHARNRGRQNTPEQRQRNLANRRASKSATLKLTMESVAEIKVRIMAGEQQVAIAKRYGVTKANITAIKKDKTWRDVCPENWAQFVSRPGAVVGART